MRPQLNERGEVKIRYVKKRVSNKEADYYLVNGAYFLLHDLGHEKIIAFRRSIDLDEDLLPRRLEIVTNDDELKRCLDYFEPIIR